MRNRQLFFIAVLFLCAALLLPAAPPKAMAMPATAPNATYYVATDGVDADGRGTEAAPWRTITYALDNVPDGSLILVKPGEYGGRVRLRGNFTQGVIVRSQVPYQARLRNSADKVISTFDGCSGITLEGFDISHGAAGAAIVVVHIEGGGEEGYVTNLTLYNNVIHDSYNNDILKINNGASHITVRGNLFYNQSRSDEHIDVNSVKDVVVEENVFLNDFAGSGRTNDSETSAYVVVKDSNDTDDWVLGSERVSIRRNVFLNWEGGVGYGFVQLGEDGTANFEAIDVLVENNLMLGNSANRMRSPFAAMGVSDATFRNNTIVGDFPSSAFAMRLYNYGDNQPNQNMHFYNNIWSDATGTMGSFSDSPPDETDSFDLGNNLYWNNGAAIPSDSGELINYTDDTSRIVANPVLGSQAGLVIPRWVPANGQFADGSVTIRQAFERLVTNYGTPGAGSQAINTADPANTPGVDILGNPRSDNSPDIGAVESGAPPEPDFSIQITPNTQKIPPGGTASYTISVQPSNGFSGAVALTANNPSSDLDITIDPISLTLPGQTSATITVVDQHSVPLVPGQEYAITITATSGSLSHSASAELRVGSNQAPAVPANPDPANNASDVSISAVLRWQGSDADGDALTYSVALGTSNPPGNVVNTTTSLYDPSLEISTTYYWQISASDGISTTVGPVWQFTTSDSAQTTIYLPMLIRSGD